MGSMKGKKKRKIKTVMLCVIAGFLVLTSVVVIYADVLIGRIYSDQQKNLLLNAHAGPLPVLQPTSTPEPTPEPTPELTPTPIPTPTPTRAPREGDIENVNFPDYDTGEGANYSHQSNELRIAVKQVQEDGVTYYVADIWMRNINCFQTAFSSGKFRGSREHAEKIAQDNNSILAVNGDFLNGLVIRNGKLYREAEARDTFVEGSDTEPDPTEPIVEQPEQTLRPERSVCVLYKSGRLVTKEFEDFEAKPAMRRGAWQGWQFGPTLVRKGKGVKDVNAQGRSPRCILGYYEPGHYAIIMIDGRQKGYSIGMNFKEMIKLARNLGLQEAYNLDGGGSAIMVFGGAIINRPSGEGEARRLPDMIVIGEYAEQGQIIAPSPSPED
ncbi:MAG TPA: phosphodiester glycosidase family protein [Clostridia bacterium]|nr:phosphodiester glycosidase family protein [Clostridia bacterium]